MYVKSFTRTSRHSQRIHATGASSLSLVDDPQDVVRQLRQEWLRRIILRFGIFVGIPTILASIYFGVIASNQYESFAVLEIQSSDAGSPNRADPLLGLGANPNTSTRELLAIREFILSRATFDALVESTKILSHFNDPRWDRFSRLPSRASRERAYLYYQRHVSVENDSASGTLSLRVRAFEPSVAQNIAVWVIAAVEHKLDEVAERAQSVALREAERQLDHAKERVVAAKLGAQQLPEADSERAKLELEFAERAFQTSMIALAELRVREVRRRPLLVALAPPSLPDSSSYPRRTMSILTVFVFSAIALGIGSLSIAAIREHARN